VIAAAYRAVQGRVVDVASAAPDPAQNVAACPAWSVADVVRHVTGIAADIVAGNLEGWPTEEWTAAQVALRSGRDLEEVVAEWNDLLEPLCAIFDDPDGWEPPQGMGSALKPIVGTATLSDLTQHEFDLRNAVGIPGDRSDPVVHMVATGYVKSLRPAFATKGLPTLHIESTDLGRGWNLGHDEPSAVLRATSFELMRTIGGRRTEEEVVTLDWEGDAVAFLAHVVSAANANAKRSLGERE